MEEMETLKMKIGPHEFEATGSPESVREKFQAFREMVATLQSAAVKGMMEATKKSIEIIDGVLTTESQLAKIMQVNGREISLTARPQTLADATLLLIFGQKALRENDAVTGSEIISGLNTTGGYSFNRIDGMLEKLARDGDLLTFGERRGKKYRLTNTGLAKARAIAAELISSAA
jgi:hypothetical protein